MNQDLVKINNNLAGQGDRQRALTELAHAAEHAATPEDAQELMLKGRTIANLLSQAKAPFEEARLAGKASVLAAKRLGTLISEVSAEKDGHDKSPRRHLCDSLGILRGNRSTLTRLAQVDNADFQRYIQRPNIIPSINGALIACNVIPKNRYPDRPAGTWRDAKKKRVGVKTPRNPSLDACYSLIVQALGHATASNPISGHRKRHEIAAVIDHLYAAEDLLKKYRGGYV